MGKKAKHRVATNAGRDNLGRLGLLAGRPERTAFQHVASPSDREHSGMAATW